MLSPSPKIVWYRNGSNTKSWVLAWVMQALEDMHSISRTFFQATVVSSPWLLPRDSSSLTSSPVRPAFHLPLDQYWYFLHVPIYWPKLKRAAKSELMITIFKWIEVGRWNHWNHVSKSPKNGGNNIVLRNSDLTSCWHHWVTLALSCIISQIQRNHTLRHVDFNSGRIVADAVV